ncbi:MAG: hypothetical protein Kow0020_13100 [Wenzhouxiangellaceae bacterium]
MIRTDLHCHLLPGIDDGARDLEQSLAMARIALQDGIRTVVATPHHLNGVYTNPAAQVRARVQALRDALADAGIALEVLPGAELHLVPELPEQLARGEALTIGDHGRAVLVELPVHQIPVGADQILEHLLAMALTPVIAHPERNSQLRRQPERLAEWVSWGCLGQLTAQSCTGRFGPEVQQVARSMLLAGSIQVVASDAHRDRRRIPRISPAAEQIAQWSNVTLARVVTVDIPQAIGRGEAPDLEAFRAALPETRPRRWWQRWLGKSG